MIAIVALFFFFSAPIENTEVVEANYARLLPGELFEQIEKQSLVITPIVVHQQAAAKKAKASQTGLSQSAGKKVVAPVAVKEVKVRRQSAAAPVQPKTGNDSCRSCRSARQDALPYHHCQRRNRKGCRCHGAAVDCQRPCRRQSDYR